MLDERSEHEPEEYDAESEMYDPESDSLTIPQVTIPEIEAEPTDVSSELAREFWILVFVLDVALVAVSLGAMLLYFRGDLRWGGAAFAGGIALLALSYVRYRRARSIASEAAAADVDGSDSDEGEEDDRDGNGEAERPSTTDGEPTSPVDADTDDS